MDSHQAMENSPCVVRLSGGGEDWAASRVVHSVLSGLLPLVRDCGCTVSTRETRGVKLGCV